MTLSGKSAFLAALLFVAALGLYHYADSLINPKQAPKAPEKLYTATGFSGSIFNEQGKRTRTLEAEVAIYHEDSGIYTFQKPVFTSIRANAQGGDEIWQISGRYGEARESDFVNMSGDVVLVPLFDGAAIEKAWSEAFHYDLKGGVITSDYRTYEQGRGWINSGDGFKLNVNTNIMTYEGNVHATYDPAQAAK
ncbi:MAG: LPS export ABC transporter periplasmic protein LptC [Succinivibrio sp.]|jgi:LPS export ABC transporter protein LptC|nr:LPS export ABC transporter periplasmic protein LptC [Succinivibrio sp.]